MDAAAPWLPALREAALDHPPLLVAFSGGLDSTVLLHALAAHPPLRAAGLRALHIDHRLHPDSGRWAEHCVRVCAAIGVELQQVCVDVQPQGEGLEAAARAARYAAFARALRPGETLALAQHADDQAETVLLRLLRGAGGRGLAGMPPHRGIGRNRLWRPLLALSRAELLAYARHHGLAWLEDPSNRDTGFDRNFVRHRVLPLLQSRWPQAARTLAASAGWQAEAQALLDEAVAERLAAVQGLDPATVSVAALQALSPAWQRQVLRAWLAALGLPPMPSTRLAEALGPLLAARDDALPSLQWRDAVLRRWSGLLWAGTVEPPWPRAWERPWDGIGDLTLPDGRVYRLQRDDAGAPLALHVRLRRGGERLMLPGRSHHSELKQVLQSLGLPPWQRERLPLLFEGDTLLAAGEWVASQTLRQRGWRWRPVAN